MISSTQDKSGYIASLIASHQPGRSLQRPFYTDPEVFDWDMQRIFRRMWLPVAFGCRIPSKGDYFVHTVGAEQIIIVRGQDEKVHAHYNVCRHRGSRICLEQSGSVKKFVCPYHAWVYDCDGSFVGARHLHEDTNKAELGLVPVHARELEGMIFICLSEGPPPDFQGISDDLGPYMKPHGLSRGRLCHREQFQINANWKIVAENQWECYHCAPAHPELAEVMSYVAGHDSKTKARERLEFEEQWVSFAKSIGHMTGGVDRDGIDEWYMVRRTPIRPGWNTQSRDGKPVAPLMGDFKQYDGAVTGLNFHPLSFSVLNNDHAVLLRFTPLGPTRTDIELSWIVDKDAPEPIDVERITWLWKATGAADAKICEDNQSGVNSVHYTPGPHSKMESRIDWLITWYLRQISPHPEENDPDAKRSAGKTSRQIHFLMLDGSGEAPKIASA